MVDNHPSKWFTEDLRDRITRYVTAGANTRTHIMELRISGPGALRRRALCGGLQPVVIVSSSLDLANERECMNWLTGFTGVLAARGVNPGSNLFESATIGRVRPLCVRCASRYERLEGFVAPEHSY